MFQNPKLTNAGKALFYENMSGEQIVFTTIKLGSGELTQPIAAMTDLISPEVVVDASTTAEADYVEISGTFANTELAAGFYWREVGVFAANPAAPNDRSQDILYCYQNAYDTADYIPTASVETIEKHICVPVIVGDAANVVCNLQGSLINASLQDIANHNTSSQAHQDIRQLLGKCPQLDESGKIPDNVLPDMDFIPKTARGQAGGVASLNTSGKIPIDQLVVDTALSATSDNPVQNKIVQQAIASINQALAGKAASNHSHTLASLGAAAANHSHTAAQVGAAAANHSHTLASLGAAAANHGHDIASLGGCRIVSGSYVGNGSGRYNNAGGQYINVGAPPKCVFVAGVGKVGQSVSTSTGERQAPFFAVAGSWDVNTAYCGALDISGNGFYVGNLDSGGNWSLKGTNVSNSLYIYIAII